MAIISIPMGNLATAVHARKRERAESEGITFRAALPTVCQPSIQPSIHPCHSPKPRPALPAPFARSILLRRKENVMWGRTNGDSDPENDLGI